VSPRDAAPGPAPESSTPGAGTPAAAAPPPGLRERGRLRRRVRYLRKLRELELRDLGGLVFDMYRFASKRQDLVREKLQVMFEHDAELRQLEARLGERKRIVEVREPGVGGACPTCGTLHSSDARFCAGCGRPLGNERSTDREAAAAAVAGAPAGEPAGGPKPAPPTEPAPTAARIPAGGEDLASPPAPDDDTAVVPAASPEPEAGSDSPTTEIGTARR
jgi:hypothetical protein